MQVLAARLREKERSERAAKEAAHAQGPDRQRRPQRPHPHLQLPAGPAHRPPHQPDALQAADDHGRRPRRGHRGAAGGARGRAAGRARERPAACSDARPSRRRWRGARALGVDRLDAQLLLAHALRPARRAWLIAHDDAALATPHGAAFAATAARAAPPASRWPTWSARRSSTASRCRSTPDVLVPRPDTETLVDWALELLAGPLPAPRVRRPRHRQRRDRAGRQARLPDAPRCTPIDAQRRARWPSRARNARRLGLAVAASPRPTGGRRRRRTLRPGAVATRPTSPPATRTCRAAPRAARGAGAGRATAWTTSARIVAGAPAHLRAGRLAAARARLRPGRRGARPAGRTPASTTVATRARPGRPAALHAAAAPAG